MLGCTKPQNVSRWKPSLPSASCWPTGRGINILPANKAQTTSRLHFTENLSLSDSKISFRNLVVLMWVYSTGSSDFLCQPNLSYRSMKHHPTMQQAPGFLTRKSCPTALSHGKDGGARVIAFTSTWLFHDEFPKVKSGVKQRTVMSLLCCLNIV